MSNELAKREDAAVAPRSVYEVLGSLARDPAMDVARLTALFDLQIKAEQWDAEKQFNAAFARLQPKLPRIAKRGKIKLVKDGIDKGTIPFVTIDDLDAAIRPLYTEEGFTLSFLSKPCAAGIIRMGVLRHCGGHAITSEMQLPPDAGPGRNGLQALGSSMTYADRYLTRGLFNILAAGEDNDGTSFGTITELQQKTLAHAIQTVGVNEEMFFKTYGIKALSELPKVVYGAAQGLIEAKYRLKWKNEGADDQECNERCAGLWK